MDTDRVASATSRSNQAVAKYYTPNGLRVLHLHRKVQVIDTVNNEIKYSPKTGEKIWRTIATKEGGSVNEFVPLPDLRSGRSSAQRTGFEQFDKAMMFGKRLAPSTSNETSPKEGLLKPVISRRISENVVTLRQGDRIVTENNKIKFRVTIRSPCH